MLGRDLVPVPTSVFQHAAPFAGGVPSWPKLALLVDILHVGAACKRDGILSCISGLNNWMRGQRLKVSENMAAWVLPDSS